MPRGDGTGPLGLGPMTGRGLGYCAGFGQPGYMTPGPGFGWGRGWWGRGLAWRRGWWGYPWWAYPVYPSQPTTPTQEKTVLKEEKEILTEQVNILKEEIKAIEERLKELESKKRK